jgi:protein-S-isoprenylcysteine O-methyltransferase Ste14
MPGNPLTDPNWAPDLADQITGFVGKVRDATTNNAVKAARAAVFGFVGLLLGITVVVLLLITLTRGLQSLLDAIGMDWSRAVYVSYLGLGGILSIAGWFLMRKRASR